MRERTQRAPASSAAGDVTAAARPPSSRARCLGRAAFVALKWAARHGSGPALLLLACPLSVLGLSLPSVREGPGQSGVT